MGLFGKRKKSTTTISPRPRVSEVMKVAGTSHHQNEIQNLGYDNDDYDLSKKELMEDYEDEKVYRLQFDVIAKLVPEPDNKHDHNAIRVEADDVLIGYVPKNKTQRVRELLADKAFHHISLDIFGGPYKLAEDGIIEKDTDPYDAELVFYSIQQ